MTNATPLVCVLIRTIGRATLARSVASALAQTHRPLEIVIVNAGAQALPPLPTAGDVEIQVVEPGPCNRPRAANVALANASGDWRIFLDDDDAFAPDHVASLLHAARRSEAGVAYSATQCVDAAGGVDIVMGAPFNRLHLLHGNYIQIGAALFNRSIVADAVRFDESLDCLQDWDFWIQLAQRTHFAYTGIATNLWMGPNQRDEVTHPFRERIVAKWAAYAHLLHGKVRHHREAARAAMERGNAASAQRHTQSALAVSMGPIARRRSRSRAARTPHELAAMVRLGR